MYAQGGLRARGVSFGVRLWEIDFSEARVSGEGLRLKVQLVSADEPDDAPRELESLPFPVEAGLFTSRMARGLSLHNARLRHAPASMGGGYYDCNSQMGEAYSHAMFAAGLIELERLRAVRLDANERTQLRAEIERRVRSSLAFLEREGELYPELGAAAHARLYAHSGSERDLQAGVRHVVGFTPRTRFRHPLRGVPWFEGMALLAHVVKPVQRERWRASARSWSAALQGAAERNGFGVVAPLGEAEWDDASAMPVSRVEHAFFANAHFLATSYDALLLAELTGDVRLERLASAGLQWVTGVNPGIRSADVMRPRAAPGEPPRVAALVVDGVRRSAAGADRRERLHRAAGARTGLRHQRVAPRGDVHSHRRSAAGSGTALRRPPRRASERRDTRPSAAPKPHTGTDPEAVE